MQHTTSGRRYLVPSWVLVGIALLAFLTLVFAPLPPASAEEAPPVDAPVVLEEVPAVEVQAPAPAPAVDPPAAAPEPVALQTASAEIAPLVSAPTVEVFWAMPKGSSPTDVGWPQAYQADPTDLDCGIWYQVDLYLASEAPGFYADGVLTQGEDYPSNQQAGAISWRWVYGGDCVITTNKACPAVGSVHTTNLASWDLSQSRSQSTTVLTPAGLQLDTFGPAGSPDQRKAAGYYGTNFALADTGSLALNWTGTSPAPGGQLATDLDNNGTVDGFLVFESVYGSHLWASGSIQSGGFVGLPTHGGGGGPISGTIDEYLAAYPDARVYAIGYSLGSGVTGSGVISSIVAGCIEYTFGLAPLPAPETGSDVSTSTDCETATVFTTTTAWSISYSYDANQQPVAGTKVYGDPVITSAPATIADLDAAECPLPEEPEPFNETITTRVVDCAADTVTVTSQTKHHTWILVDREWVEVIVTDEPVVEVLDADDETCPPVVVPETPAAPSQVLAFTGIDPSPALAAGLGLLLLGLLALVGTGGAAIARRRRG